MKMRTFGPFSEFVDAEQPLLTLPIPPTFTLEETAHAVPTAPPTTQPISLSDPTGTNTVDNHYQLRSLWYTKHYR